MNAGASERLQQQNFGVLRRLLRKAENAERCELCRQNLAPLHDHLLEPETRRLLCSCQACAILFDGPSGQYKRVPRRTLYLPGRTVSDAEWDALMIPIGIAFFVKHSAAGGADARIAAYYPSPAGPVESLLSLDAWEEISSRDGVVSGMVPDTEALLVNRTARESFVLPIDECYRLVGLMRAQWKGLSGGAEVWRGIQLFFEEMKGRAGERHA